MSAPTPQPRLTAARRLVVKMGTQLLTRRDPENPGLDARYIATIARQVAALRAQDHEITLVASGAIGAGCAELGLHRRPTDVAEAQAVAAVGQRRLMDQMHRAFARHNLEVGQILLTRSDFDDRQRFLNIRNCINHLHQIDCIPIINENDTVAVEEIRFGDNDTLAALTCNAIRADALILLTVVDGLLDEAGNVIARVDDVMSQLALVRREHTHWGSGGMASKLEAARIVTEAGELAVIAHGRTRDILPRLLAGETIGTLFRPAQRKLDSRQRWIGLTKRPAGTLTVDDGAATALRSRGKSLLATGITDVTGRFERGDVLLVRDEAGHEIARGLSNYASDEIRRIQGKKSNQFEKILGRPAYAEVIHRDNLVLLDNGRHV
ncbi:MAG: glutamate 5-kinase [Phycisphaeraceae bacterium]